MTAHGKSSTVKIGKAFRVVLPAEFREQFNLQEGEALSVEMQGSKLVLTPLREKQRAIQAKYAGRFPGMLEELFAERRAEAERE
ncbi:AbrB/MazE/SpoVT family DNA-binding domain-containing protein [Deinococcus sp.]|uniref:AbrB/MazE/SpoVT family DNA-binding domain-containing protein n=1 Tax=Deinococcus sp. TaxID=47478 RepID=UPI003B5B13CA